MKRTEAKIENQKFPLFFLFFIIITLVFLIGNSLTFTLIKMKIQNSEMILCSPPKNSQYVGDTEISLQ